MKRIRLDEDTFRTLIQTGEVTIEGFTLKRRELMNDSDKFERMIIHGEEIEHNEAKIILADIGYNLINRILAGM